MMSSASHSTLYNTVLFLNHLSFFHGQRQLGQKLLLIFAITTNLQLIIKQLDWVEFLVPNKVILPTYKKYSAMLSSPVKDLTLKSF